MAYPTSVGVQSWLFSSAGPFISSAGNTYFLGENPSNSAQLLVRKASDPSSTWSTAATGTPSSGQLACVDACQDGDVLHVVVSQNNLVLYRQFDMSSDAWLGSWTTVDSLTAGQEVNNQQARIAKATNGNLVIAYNDRDANYWYGLYAKVSTDNGANWGSELTVSYDGSSKSSVLGDLVPDANGRVHCFYTRTESPTTTTVRQRTITTAGALGTDQQVVGTAGSASLTTFAEYGPQTVGHGDSRDGAIVVPYVNNNARAAVITATPDSDTPTWSTAEVSAAAVERVGYFTDAHDSWLGAALGPAGEAFVAWIDASSNDVFYDTDRTGSFGTDTDFNNITGIGVICRVVERSAGYFLALAWIDSSENFQYHEVQVGTKGTAETAFSLTATADGEVTPGGETIEGTAEAAFMFVASAEGEVTPPTVEGEASADFTFTATGTGLVARQATAAAAFTATMAAEGTVVKRASASAAFSFAATAEVSTTPRARAHFVFQAQFVPSPYVSPSSVRNVVVRSTSRRHRWAQRLGRRPR